MKRTVVTIALAMLLVGVLALPAAAGNPFRNVTSTADGYSTWDSDLVSVEQVSETGAGIYVAVLDTGLAPDWRDFFPEERIATSLGKGFYQSVTFKSAGDPCELDTTVGRLREASWIGSSTATHGTHVTSTIIGYFYRSNYDALAGFPLPPIMVRGIAPDATIIPVKVLADYQLPAMPQCHDEYSHPAQAVNFGTDEMVAAGINYATDLAIAGYRPMVINMSLGGPDRADIETDAIDRAITNGVIVVASAGNEGEDGMGYPGAYAPVISAGSAGWIDEWLYPDTGEPRYRMWWLQSGLLPFTDILEPTPVEDVYVSDFSSRQLAGQQLDVLAPGSWVRGPYPGDPGYAHLPWWSRGIGDLLGRPTTFLYVGGTSMAAPHVTSIAALMLQANPSLMQADIEDLLKTTALPILAGSAHVYDGSALTTVSWGDDATGAGLVQADAAVAAAAALP